MAEKNDYIKREDAIKAFADYLTETAMEDLGIKHGKQILYELHCDDVSNILADIPSADVVEVVRCKDCKHNPKRTNDLAYGRCVCCCEDDWYGYVPADDFFCGYGERKDNE